MRIHPRLYLATPTTTKLPTSTPPALLPPIPLYRRILRAHRHKLPKDMRVLGDLYVKSEFKAHKNVENPVHIIGFLTEWQMYVQKLEGDTWREERLDKGRVDRMSDQQLGQLYELMQATRTKGERGDNEGER